VNANTREKKGGKEGVGGSERNRVIRTLVRRSEAVQQGLESWGFRCPCVLWVS
jgi:hypothetical protein